MVTWESLQKYAANGVLSNTKTEHTQKRARDDLRKSQAELVAVHWALWHSWPANKDLIGQGECWLGGM